MARHDPELETEVVAWVERVTGMSKGGDSVGAWLHDGKVLCGLANKVSPGGIKKVHDSTMPWKQMENVTAFIHFARATGVPESSVFGTPDLYEEKNMNAVIMCIYMFGGAVQTAYPGFAGPSLGVAMRVKTTDGKRDVGLATQMGGLQGALEVERARGNVLGRAGPVSPRLLGSASPRPVSPRPALLNPTGFLRNRDAFPRAGSRSPVPGSPRAASPRPTGAAPAARPVSPRPSGFLRNKDASPRPGSRSPVPGSPRAPSPRPVATGAAPAASGFLRNRDASPRPGSRSPVPGSPRAPSPRPVATGATPAARAVSPRPSVDSTCGLDAELKRKMDASYDHDLEKQVVTWVEQVSGQSKGGQSVGEWLHDGQVLCALFNAIKPGSIAPNTSKSPFKQMENIKFFTDACRKLGVLEYVMFATPDLFEEKNIGSVIKCIYALGGEVQKKVPTFLGPKLGLASADVHDQARQKVAATQGGGFAGVMEVRRPSDAGAMAR